MARSGEHAKLGEENSGYNVACAASNIIQLRRWDHARRKFKEAQDAQPKPRNGQTHKASKASHMLAMINHLYKIEREITSLSANEKFQQGSAAKFSSCHKEVRRV